MKEIDARPVAPDVRESASSFGFNLIGLLTANIGLGVAARNIARLLRDRGFALAAFNIEAGHGRDDPRLAAGLQLVDKLDDLPHPINIVVLAGYGLISFRADHADYFGDPGRLDVLVHFWELPTLPPRWVPSLESFDVIVAMSDFIAWTHRFALSGPVIVDGRTPVNLPKYEPFGRSRIGVPADAVTFITAFEPRSEPARKNPHAVVRAFLLASREVENAWLVIRMNNAILDDGTTHAVVEELETLAAGHPRVVLVSESLSYAEVIALYAACDVYVSMHRAEGLGLGMAEAMLLGKPVIATGWSGNLAFMDQQSTALLRYRLAPVMMDTGHYRQSHLDEGTRWAEADVEHAAAWIKVLTTDRCLRERIGTAAAVKIGEWNRIARSGSFIDEVICLAAQRKRFGAYKPVRSDEVASDSLSTSRLARIQTLERELGWIKSRPSYRLLDGTKRTIKALLSKATRS